MSVETRMVVVEREVAHPAEKVWRALTEGALLERWLMANDFAPVVGHRFQFRGVPNPHWNGIVDGEVLEVTPPERLAYRWDSAGVDSVVTWTVRPTEKGVLVRMEQGLMVDLPEHNLNGARYAWTKFVAQLDDVVGKMD